MGALSNLRSHGRLRKDGREMPVWGIATGAYVVLAGCKVLSSVLAILSLTNMGSNPLEQAICGIGAAHSRGLALRL